MSRDDALASVEERLERLLDLPIAPADLREPDATGAGVGACLEASRLRTQHDAITPPIARALLRTGVWKPDDLRRFLAGCSAPGAAALIAGACCEALETSRLPEVLQVIEAETDPDFAGHATRHLTAHCLRTDQFELAERAVGALAARERTLRQGSNTAWLTTALAVHEQLHGHGDPRSRMSTLIDGHARELFEEWLSGNQEPWRTARPLESEAEGRREALLAVLGDSSDAAAGTRGSFLDHLGERSARNRALTAVLNHARATSDPGMLLRAATFMQPGRSRRNLVREAIALSEHTASERVRGDADTAMDEPGAITEVIPTLATTHDPILRWLTEAGLHPALAANADDAMCALAAEHEEIGTHLLDQVGESSEADAARARSLCRIAPFLHTPGQLDAAARLAAELGSTGHWAPGYAKSGAEGIGAARGVISALAPRLTRPALLRALDLGCLAPPPTRESWRDLRLALGRADALPGEIAAPLIHLACAAPEGLDVPALLLRLEPGDCLQAATRLPPEYRSELLAAAAGDATLDQWRERERYALLHRGRQCRHARSLLELRLRPPRSENALLAVLEGLNRRLVPTTKIAPALATHIEAMTDSARLRLLARVRRLPLWLRLELLPGLLERTLSADENEAVVDGAVHLLRESLVDICGEQPVLLGRHTSNCIAGLGSDLLTLTSPQLHRLVDRLAPTTEARHLRELIDTLLDAAEQDPSALDLVAVAAQLPGFEGDARAAPLLESWIEAQKAENRHAPGLPQAAWDCLDLEALERLEKVFGPHVSDPGLPLRGLLFANSCRRCWVERSPHAALDRVERALEAAERPNALAAELGALDAMAAQVDAPHLGRYLELYRRLYEADASRPTIAGFAGIMLRALALGHGMEEVLSWTAFAPGAQRMEPIAALSGELDAREKVDLWRWQLARTSTDVEPSTADHTRSFAAEIRMLAATLREIGTEQAASLWRLAASRAPELDEEACLALVCAFLPQLTRMHGPSALTQLVCDFEQRVASAARAAAAAGPRRR